MMRTEGTPLFSLLEAAKTSKDYAITTTNLFGVLHLRFANGSEPEKQWRSIIRAPNTTYEDKVRQTDALKDAWAMAGLWDKNGAINRWSVLDGKGGGDPRRFVFHKFYVQHEQETGEVPPAPVISPYDPACVIYTLQLNGRIYLTFSSAAKGQESAWLSLVKSKTATLR